MRYPPGGKQVRKLLRLPDRLCSHQYRPAGPMDPLNFLKQSIHLRPGGTKHQVWMVFHPFRAVRRNDNRIEAVEKLEFLRRGHGGGGHGGDALVAPEEML